MFERVRGLYRCPIRGKRRGGGGAPPLPPSDDPGRNVQDRTVPISGSHPNEQRLGALCIERRILPFRVYRDAAGSTRRYFPLKLPVALDVERAVLVYVDPGYETARALRSRGAAHRGLWKTLRERCRSVRVVAVVRTSPG